ncbi:HCP-like protein [Gonapodya prolifera JEL478]|uniref:HCP-like protein n=1 Tax=Gonapodya prolifera (strain JEL478) TaxID=1344416 RepID=A0A139AY17_GONPJ|nr:HCP-like protein [Gonapodya prolifera JEL478]|eukprot:KXS21610.1 HCP-like protein [Gonapodya prolifera JEL478]
MDLEDVPPVPELNRRPTFKTNSKPPPLAIPQYKNQQSVVQPSNYVPSQPQQYAQPALNAPPRSNYTPPPQQPPQAQRLPGPFTAPGREGGQSIEHTLLPGRGGPVPKAQTVALLRQNAEKSDDPAVQFEFSKYVIEYAGTIQDHTEQERLLDEGFQWLRKLATRLYPDAQNYLAVQYAADGDYDKAFPLWYQASKHSHAASCFEAGRCYETGQGAKRDFRKAQQFYVKAASAGYVPAMYRLGASYLTGEVGLKRDPKEAVKWLKRAEDKGDARSAFALAQLFEEGYPPAVYQDLNYARTLYEEAAEKGLVASQLKLGHAYEKGLLGLPVSPRDSVRWFLMAASQGDRDAEYSMAGWHLTGAEGTLKPSPPDAFMWAMRSAQQGLPKAEYAVAYFFEMGIGTAANSQEALKWYRLAAQHGEERARKRLNAGDSGRSAASPDQVRDSVVDGRKTDKDCSIM